MEIKEIESTSDKPEKLEDKFAKLSVKTNVMKIDVNDDDNEYASMNDFHLAETDLIRCLMRTNILQRIRYDQMSIICASHDYHAKFAYFSSQSSTYHPK